MTLLSWPVRAILLAVRAARLAVLPLIDHGGDRDHDDHDGVDEDVDVRLAHLGQPLREQLEDPSCRAHAARAHELTVDVVRLAGLVSVGQPDGRQKVRERGSSRVAYVGALRLTPQAR